MCNYKVPYTKEQLFSGIRVYARFATSEGTALINKIEENNLFSGGKRIYWVLYSENNTQYFSQSITSLVDELHDMQAKKHPTDGA